MEPVQEEVAVEPKALEPQDSLSSKGRDLLAFIIMGAMAGIWLISIVYAIYED